MAGPRPVLLRTSDLPVFYKVDIREAETITAGLKKVGQWGKDPLFARTEVEKAIKERA